VRECHTKQCLLAHCDCRTSNWWVSDDRKRRLDGMSHNRRRSAARYRMVPSSCVAFHEKRKGQHLPITSSVGVKLLMRVFVAFMRIDRAVHVIILRVTHTMTVCATLAQWEALQAIGLSLRRLRYRYGKKRKNNLPPWWRASLDVADSLNMNHADDEYRSKQTAAANHHHYYHHHLFENRSRYKR